MRAVVRRRLDSQVHGVTDALGDLVAIDADTVSVRTRHGMEVIDRATVVAAKEVPPAPSRRGAPHLAVSMQDLETILAQGWPAPERTSLGDWVLRAGAGFTARANSVLPLGSPGLSLSEAVDYCEGWYDERGLRPLFALFGPAGFAVEDDLPRAFATSPIRMVSDEFLPTLFQHGTADVVVPFADTVKMAETVNTRVRAGLATVRPLLGEIHGGPRFYAPDNIVATLRWIDERIGRDHDYTPLPEIGTIGTHVDDGVELPADNLSVRPGVTTLPTSALEPVRDRLEVWSPTAGADVPRGV